jgi:hypothetical protein
MNTFGMQDLRRLLQVRETPCISIYMPAHWSVPDNKQDPIRYRGLLQQARELLATKHSPREIRALLDPLERTRDDPFWRTQRSGLVVFRSPSVHEEHRLGVRVPELVVVADTFHTAPLVPLARRDRRFHVLALSVNRATLWTGQQGSLELRDVPGMPTDLQSALRIDQFETYRNSYGQNRGQILHGTGAGAEEQKELLEPYFRAVDRAVREALRDDHGPLIVAAVAHHRALYRAISQYPNVLEKGPEGNHDRESAHELHEAVWPIVAEWIAHEEDEALARFRELPRSEDLGEIASSIVQGRVADIFVADDRHVWGVVDRATGEIRVQDGQRDGVDGDLVDDLAEMAALRGARVWVLPAERMPTRSPAAASYRW